MDGTTPAVSAPHRGIQETRAASSAGVPSAHVLQELDRDAGREFRSPGAAPRLLHEGRPSELGEHLAVARRREVDRQLRGQLGQGLLPGFKCGRQPDRQVGRRSARGRGFGVDRGAHVADASGGTRFMTTSSACCAATRVIAGPKAATDTCTSGSGRRNRKPWLRHLVPIIVAAIAGKDRAEAIDGLPHARSTARPFPVVPAGDDRRAGRAERELDFAAGQLGDR